MLSTFIENNKGMELKVKLSCLAFLFEFSTRLRWSRYATLEDFALYRVQTNFFFEGTGKHSPRVGIGEFILGVQSDRCIPKLSKFDPAPHLSSADSHSGRQRWR